MTGLLGPSGCGKSTLMRAIVGVQRVAGGTVEVLGAPAGSASLRRRVGYVTQAPVGVRRPDACARTSPTSRACSARRAADVDRAIATVGLGDDAAGRSAALSGGQRIRASLAVALLGAPELLVLDEPTVGLDPVLRRDLWRTFHELVAGGVTILVSSHVMEEAAECDALLLMRDGALVAATTPAELRERTGCRRPRRGVPAPHRARRGRPR